MDRTDDIEFLKQYKTAVETYVGPAGSGMSPLAEFLRGADPRAEQARQVIAEGRGRAQLLLKECGCRHIVSLSPRKGSPRQPYRLLDLVTNNHGYSFLSTTYFTDPLAEAIGLLKASRRISPSPQTGNEVPDELTDLDYSIMCLEDIARGFTAIASGLAKRYDDRAPFDINDEYDVQDIFAAFLPVWFDDVRREEPVPSLAGTSSRIDFLLAKNGICLEIKMTRTGLANKRLKDQLCADIINYPHHPACKAIVIFVYDPGCHLQNLKGFEDDLSAPINGVPVKVYVARN